MSNIGLQCPICGKPTDTLESPISGECVSPNYECPDNCEHVEWMKNQGLKEIKSNPVSAIKQYAEQFQGTLMGEAFNDLFKTIQDMETDFTDFVNRFNFAISERDGARRAAKEYRLENEKLEKELKRKSLLLEHALELIEDREKETEEWVNKTDKWVERADNYRIENEQLRKDKQYWYETWEQERDLARGQKEQLRKERDEAREKLWEAAKTLEYIIVKTGNEPFNVQFIVKPLRDVALKALSHIQGKETPIKQDIQVGNEVVHKQCRKCEKVIETSGTGAYVEWETGQRSWYPFEYLERVQGKENTTNG